MYKNQRKRYSSFRVAKMAYCSWVKEEIYKDNFAPGQYVCSQCSYPLFSRYEYLLFFRYVCSQCNYPLFSRYEYLLFSRGMNTCSSPGVKTLSSPRMETCSSPGINTCSSSGIQGQYVCSR
jgi:hypothetical protein